MTFGAGAGGKKGQSSLWDQLYFEGSEFAITLTLRHTVFSYLLLFVFVFEHI